MGSINSKPALDLASAEQDQQVIALKRHGLTFQQIAGQLDISSSQAHRAFHRGLRAIVEPEVTAYRSEQLALIETAREAVLDVLTAAHVTVSEGRALRDVTDHMPVLQAVDRLLKLADHEAKLLGLYAEQRVSLSGGVRYELVGIDPADLT